jgi:hypothetical protein
MAPMFKNDLIPQENMEDVGGPDGLVKGMILGTKKDNKIGHGGVYAGLHDFGNGPEHAVYSCNTKTNRGNPRRFADVPGEWVDYGWHKGVILSMP